MSKRPRFIRWVLTPTFREWGVIQIGRIGIPVGLLVVVAGLAVFVASGLLVAVYGLVGTSALGLYGRSPRPTGARYGGRV